MTQLSANEKVNARRQGLQAIAAAIAVSGLVWGGWHWVSGRHHVSTDNA